MDCDCWKRLGEMLDEDWMSYDDVAEEVNKLTPRPITPKVQDGRRVQVWHQGKWVYAHYHNSVHPKDVGWDPDDSEESLRPTPTHYLPEPEPMGVG
jgi:hypothetical protein